MFSRTAYTINVNHKIPQSIKRQEELDNNNRYKKQSADALAINRNYGTNISLTFAYSIK